MMAEGEPVPLADVARLALHADLIALDQALRLIGCERIVPAVDDGPTGTIDSAIEAEVASIEEGEDSAAESGESPEEDRAAREMVATAAHTLVEAQEDVSGATRAERDAAQRIEKSMIAYLLVPDNPSPHVTSITESYDFESVPEVVRGLIEQQVVSSRQDNWKLSLRVRDAAPLHQRPRGLDVLKTVREMARLEPLHFLPSRSRPYPINLGTVLIDHSLLLGPFRADVDTFLQTLRGPDAAEAKRYVVQRVGAAWHWTDGPLWHLGPVDFDQLATHCLALFTGWPVTTGDEEWRSLVAQAAASHRKISVILVGGDGGRRLTEPVIGSLASDR